MNCRASAHDVSYDAIVVGAGAAGLSAALVLGRARRNVLVIDDGQPRNSVAEFSHGFLTRDGERPRELLRMARRDIAAYATVEFLDAPVRFVAKRDGRFSVGVASGQHFAAPKLLLATGVFDQLPEIDGLAERWGKSVFVCPYCDGWEVRDAPIAIYGDGRDAVELAQELYGWSKDLMIYSARDDLTENDRRWLRAAAVPARIGSVRSLSGDAVITVTFDDGSEHDCRALFISAPLRQHSPLYAQIGCAIGDDGLVVVDEHFRTTVAGCYAAGDSVTARHQVVVAAASGASAAITLNCNLLEDEASELAACVPS